MISPNFEKILVLARKLTPEEIDQLLAILDSERQSIVMKKGGNDPFLALEGAWAEMGDEAITVFEHDILRQRQEPARMITIEDEHGHFH